VLLPKQHFLTLEVVLLLAKQQSCRGGAAKGLRLVALLLPEQQNDVLVAIVLLHKQHAAAVRHASHSEVRPASLGA
jgi:hypothetical protein